MSRRKFASCRSCRIIGDKTYVVDRKFGDVEKLQVAIRSIFWNWVVCGTD
jgi:hypothetical protein